VPGRKVEVLFIVVPILLVGALVFSLVDTSREVGPKLRGQIRQCSGGRARGGGPRRCIVDLSSNASIEVDIPYGWRSGPVTIVKMQKSLSGITYYEATISGDP
jgi:hypothetical protein